MIGGYIQSAGGGSGGGLTSPFTSNVQWNDGIAAIFGTDEDWQLAYDEITTDALILYEGSVGALAIKGSQVSSFSAAADTAGNPIYIKAQDGGTHSANNPDGASVFLEPGAKGSGGSGANGVVSVLAVGASDTIEFDASAGNQSINFSKNTAFVLKRNGTNAYIFDSDNFRPDGIGTFDLGRTENEWRALYLGEGASSGIYLGLDQDVRLHTAGDADLILTGNLDPEAGGTRDLGTQTTAQWANLWADAVNGADFIMANGVRLLESELYGYGRGFAIGYSSRWEDGKAIWHGSDEEKAKWMADAKPWFVVEEDFIEIHGRRIMPEQLDKLLALVA